MRILHKKAGSAAAATLGGAAVLLLWQLMGPDARREYFLLFHSLAEVFIALVASCAFVVAWNSRGRLTSGMLVVIASALLPVGVLHVLHMLAYGGMGVLPRDNTNTPTQLWVAVRYMTAAAFVAGPLLARVSMVAMTALALALAAGIGLMIATGVFPDCHINNQQTTFKYVSEYIIAAMFALSGALMWLRRPLPRGPVLAMLVWSALLGVPAELVFTGYTDVYSAWGVAGHLLMLGSFYLIYKSLVETGIRRPFEMLWGDLRIRQAQLASSEQRLRLATEATGLGTWELDVTTGSVILSPRGREIFGVNPTHDVQWDDLLSRVDEQDRQVLAEASHQARQGADEGGMDVSFRLSGAKDAITWVRLRGQAFFDSNAQSHPRAVRMLGTVQDITETVAAEEVLRKANERIANILESITDAFFFLDRSWRFTYINRAACEVLGRSRDEMLGRSIWEVYSDAVGSEFYQQYKRAMEQGVQIKFEAFYPPLDKWFSVSGYPSPDGLGVYFIDCTERRRTQQALREAHDRAEWLARFPGENPNPVLRIDTDAKLMYGNGTAMSLWGEAIALGKAVPAPLAQAVTQAMASGRCYEFEWQHEGRTWAMSCAPVPQQHYANIYASDITDRKRAQDQIRKAADELARSNRDLAQFAYVASHDLQEPLRMVTGYLQLIERRYGQALDKDGHEFMHYAIDGAARMQQLINDLLAFSRVGTRAAEPQAVDLNHVMEHVRRNLQALIAENDAIIDAGQLPVVLADESQMVQLFQNLVANAIKFRGERQPVVSISAARQDGRWEIAVADNGIGIEPQYLEKVFVIFQRLHTRDRYGGTGIGLAICKKIVERHGGRIWVESRPGEGSTFRFTLGEASEEQSL